MAQPGLARQAGELVECLVNGGWWEDSRVLKVKKGGSEVSQTVDKSPQQRAVVITSLGEWDERLK